jgi:hypothetical protein
MVDCLDDDVLQYYSSDEELDYESENEEYIEGGEPIDVYDTIERREYYSLYNPTIDSSELPNGFIEFSTLLEKEIDTLKLEGYQIFVRDIFSPHTKHKRLLLYHNTGSGKTVTMLSLAKVFISYFKMMKTRSQITIVGFTESTIMRELMRHPEFGYITHTEKAELERLERCDTETEKSLFKVKRSIIRRRITSKRSERGYFKFYGYQKFANELINITTSGELSGITLNYIYDDDMLFNERIKMLIEKGYITINVDLLETLKNGLFVCDEIHNVYNVRSKNNRGISIKYALDYLEKDNPLTSPRCLFMTATPLSGSPTEIIDLINILVPDSNYKKEEFFDEEELKPNMLEKISEICSGYVSFLKDTTGKSYPSKQMRGTKIPNIPYLTFIKCHMSKIHEDIVQKVFKNNVLPVTSSSIIDFIFPNPECSYDSILKGKCDKMLQSMTEAKAAVYTADKTWSNNVGITNKGDILSGDFLLVKNLPLYSAKYYLLVTDILNIIKNGEPGKILIYHKYVSGTGILFIKEILMRNGILDMTSEAISSTLCSICGIQLSLHENIEHGFIPCRCLTIYGDSLIDNDVTLNMFESDDNIYGNKYKIVLGSKLIQEGTNFKCLRYLMVMSVPNDISTLVQIIGRAARHNSHKQLPVELRNVSIGIYIHYSENVVSPEHYQFKKKAISYISIQKIEKEIRRYAVDCFINFSKLQNITTSSLDGLPYNPVVSFDKKSDPNYTKIYDIPKNINFSFFALEFSDREVETIIVLIKKLFCIRPVWVYEDLWDNVKNPHMSIMPQYVTKYFLEDNFKIALQLLIDPAFVRYSKPIVRNDYNMMFIKLGNSVRRIVKLKEFFILVPIDDNGGPILDHDIFMKTFEYDMYVPISITEKIQIKYEEEKIEETLQQMLKKYDKTNIILSIVKEPKYLHMYLMKNIIMKTIKSNSLIDTLMNYYTKFGIVVTLSSFIKNYTLVKNLSKNEPIGYVDLDIVYVFADNAWKKMTTSILIKNPRRENKIIIGYIVEHNDLAVFKLKPPSAVYLQQTDLRKINRGSVCETYSLEYKFDIAKKLNLKVVDKKYICDKILFNMFEREKTSRFSGKGERWLYMFNENPEIKNI